MREVPVEAETPGHRLLLRAGLVPSEGRGAWHRRQLNPCINQCTRFSYLGAPAGNLYARSPKNADAAVDPNAFYNCWFHLIVWEQPAPTV